MDDKTKASLATEVHSALKNLEYDVTQRNEYINKREKYLYGNGLWESIDFDLGQWFAEYNYLTRVVDIHASQLMGRGFNIYSYYDKEDLTPYDENPEEKKLAELRNKKLKANADLRKKAIDGIIRDNGGMAKFKDGARLGSAFGTTVYKMWYEKKDKKVKISLLESPQNYRAGWTDTDFRERDFDAYVYQISEEKAYRDYGSKIGDKSFKVSKYGDFFNFITNDVRTPQTERKMCTVIELSGYLKGWAGDKGQLKKVKRGNETPINVMIVGGEVVQVITDEDLLPKYYIVNNRQEPRKAWGVSDLPQSALDINQEIVQLQADMMTWANKNLFKIIQAKGFTPDAIPKKKARKMQVVAMSPEQSLEEMNTNFQSLGEFQKLLEQKIDSFVRITGVGRVLFDDPTINANSNQALITTLKGVIDIVEDKQTRWEPVLREMFTDALLLAARDIKDLKEAVEDDTNWFLCVEWPSVLRREDATYQQMWLNRLINGTVSLATYMEKMGDYDTSEEIDRINDEMRNPITAAIHGKLLGVMAQNLISPPQPTGPDKKFNINVNAKTDENPALNAAVVAEALGGEQGEQSVDQMVQQDQPQPQLTPDQNQPGAQSFAGSGQPTPVSPEGAIAQNNQQIGG